MSPDPLLAFRPEFPILERTTYLISNSLGAMPRAAGDALAEYARTWAERGVRAWADAWWDMSVAVGDEIAPLFGAPSGSVSMLPNVTIASAVAMSSLDYSGPRRRIIVLDGEFPSIRYVYESLGRRLGAEVVTVASPDRDGLSADEGRIREAIDERTALVAISHVLFKSAFVVDVAAVAERCREVGALLAVDAYQSVGTLPVSVEDLGADLLVGGVLKWLCGGPGGAFLYVRPELRSRLTPALTGWMAHPAPFSFEPPPMRYREDAFRFLVGTPAVPALYAAREGPRIVRRAGAEAVRAKSLRQTARLIELAEERGFRAATPRDPRRARRHGLLRLRERARSLARVERPGRRRGLPPRRRDPNVSALLHGGRRARARLRGDRRDPLLGCLAPLARSAGGRDVSRRRAAALAAFALATVALYVVSRGKWSDALIDSGREWIVPDALARGELLYRDVVYWFGPFTPYFQAAFLRLFGSSFRIAGPRGRGGRGGRPGALPRRPAPRFRSARGLPLDGARGPGPRVHAERGGGAARNGLSDLARCRLCARSRRAGLSEPGPTARARNARRGCVRRPFRPVSDRVGPGGRGGRGPLLRCAAPTARGLPRGRLRRGRRVRRRLRGRPRILRVEGGVRAECRRRAPSPDGAASRDTAFPDGLLGASRLAARHSRAALLDGDVGWTLRAGLLFAWPSGVARPRRLATSLAVLLGVLGLTALLGGAGCAVFFSAAPLVCLAGLVAGLRRGKGTRAAALAASGALGLVLSYRRRSTSATPPTSDRPLLFAFVCAAGLLRLSRCLAAQSRRSAAGSPSVFGEPSRAIVVAAFAARFWQYATDRGRRRSPAHPACCLPERPLAREIEELARTLRARTREGDGLVVFPEGEVLNLLSGRPNPIRAQTLPARIPLGERTKPRSSGSSNRSHPRPSSSGAAR